MANKGTGNKTPGSSRKKTQKQPIPINTPTSATAGPGSVIVSNAAGATAYPGIEEEIRQRAYELYEEGGRQEGFHEQDWARAETEILTRRRKESA